MGGPDRPWRALGGRARRTYNGRVLHALEMKLGIDDAGERFWALPLAVLLGTILAFFTIGEITAAPLYVSLPNGVVIAFVMAGLTVACMRPAADDTTPDDPPETDDDAPVLGSPGGPWTVVEHLGRAAPATHASTSQLIAASCDSRAGSG